MHRKHLDGTANGAAVLARLVPLAAITPSASNPRRRFDEAKLAELAASIRSKGVLQPIVVRPRFAAGDRTTARRSGIDLPAEAYELVAGERRFRAAKLAGLVEIPAVVRDLTDVEVLEVQVVENEQREDVSPIEKADGYAALLDLGVTVEDLAVRVGRSAAVIRGLLRLRKLPEAARQAVDAGKLSASTAELIARVPNATLREICAKEVLFNPHVYYDEGSRASERDREPMSYRQTKEHIAAHYMLELKQAPFSQKDAALLPGAGACTRCLKKAGNNREEYPDARADTCCDPACYGEKVAAWGTRVQNEAVAKGQTLLGGDDARRLFPHGSQLTYNAPYVDLAAICFDVNDPSGKRRTYGQILIGHLPEAEIVLCRDDKDKLHQLAPKDRAVEILRREYGVAKQAGHGGQTSAEEKREKANRILDGKVERLARRMLFERAAVAAERTACGVADWSAGMRSLLRVLTRQAVNAAWGNSRDEIIARRGLAGKDTADRVAALLADVDGMPAQACVGLLAEIGVAKAATHYSCDDQGSALLKLLGVPDFVALEKEARAQLKEGKAAKAKDPGSRKPGGRKATPADPGDDSPLPSASSTAAGDGSPEPAPITRDTHLGDLLMGSVPPYDFVALREANLITVGDLLDRAATVKGPESQRPYTVLRSLCGKGLLGLTPSSVEAIGDALIDAGTFADQAKTEPTPTPAKKRPASPRS
jgi:ParB/RepB/Spo0J family partition protein